MRRKSSRATVAVALALAGWTTVAAADGGAFPWDRVIGVDVATLTSAQRERTVALAQVTANYHGCRGTVAECVAKEPPDATARRLAGFLARRVVAGDSDEKIAEGVANRRRSAWPARPVQFDLFEAHCRGPEDAKVTIVEFGDYECPFCRAAAPFVERIVAARADRIRFCFKHFPVRSHQRAVPASIAALAADRQGKFWEAHRALFAATDLSDAGLRNIARSLGLDLERFAADIADEALLEEVQADKVEGQEAGVDSTPTFFVNGKRYYGLLTEVELADRIDEELDAVR